MAAIRMNALLLCMEPLNMLVKPKTGGVALVTGVDNKMLSCLLVRHCDAVMMWESIESSHGDH